MTDHKALIAEVRDPGRAMSAQEWAFLALKLAEALEAATDALERAVLDEYTVAEVVAGVRSARDHLATLHPGCPGCDDCSRQADLDLAANALEELCAERAVVEAQALEQAAEIIYEAGEIADEGYVAAWFRARANELRARAVEIREGRQ